MRATTASAGDRARSGLKELKVRILVVILGLAVFRLGAHVPVPGLDVVKLAELFRQHQDGFLGMFNMFSGGALSRMTVFALGVMPYISSSIIMQLMTVATPKFEQLRKEGASGRRKISQYTRYGTLALSVFQAVGIGRWLQSQSVVIDPTITFYVQAALTLSAGSMFLMWLGEQMTEKGIGNGISLIIFAGIVSRLPGAIGGVIEQVRQGQMSSITLILLGMTVAAVTAFVVFVESGQRRIRVTYARRQAQTMYGGQASHLPLKVNLSGVIPPIFASSIILLPTTLLSWYGHGRQIDWLNEIAVSLQVGEPLYIVVFAIAVIFFSFFYTALTFNPKDTADNLKRSGAFIPGVRPGKSTSEYIDGVVSRLTMGGSIYLTLVALLPQFLIMAWHVPFYFGGTSLLIIVVVIMDFMTQVQTHLMSYKYESLLKKRNQGLAKPGML